MARATVMVVVLFSLLAADAEAITRQRAVNIAAKTLRPLIDPDTTRLFSLKRPLRAKQSVQIYKGLARQAVRRKPLGRPTWIFWLDQAYGAYFEHPSVLLLIDDRTGRVRLRKRLSWYPLIDGRRPPFLRARPRLWTSRHSPHAAQAPPYVIGPEDLKRDCLIAIGDRGEDATPEDPVPDQTFRGSLEAIEGFADRVGLRRFDSPASAPGLDRTVENAIRRGCFDVFIYLAGHGTAPRGTYAVAGGEKRSAGGPARVNIGSRVVGLNSDQPVKFTKYIRPTDLEKIVTRWQGTADFKIKIDSCFSGRFDEALADKQNVRVLELSSKADEVSYGYAGGKYTAVDEQGNKTEVQNDAKTPGVSEFMDRNIFGLEEWARSPLADATGRDLAKGIALSFHLGEHRDFGAKRGWTHPILVTH